jgi:hypothetical protein
MVQGGAKDLLFVCFHEEQPAATGFASLRMTGLTDFFTPSQP